MTDYSELVKALRYCAESGDFKCGKDCPMHTEYPNCLTKMDTDAATAIEELQAIAHSHCVAASAYWEELEELKAKLPKRGEWIVKGANRIDCSVCGHSVCFAFGLSDGSFDLYKYCPKCGAKMEVQMVERNRG